jgi:enoyl-CoA hydratase/carnithine racemase
MGLVSRCFDSREGLMAGVLAAAAAIAAKSPLAVAGTKSGLLHTRWVLTADV